MEDRFFTGTKVRSPVVEGIFYPEDGESMGETIGSWNLALGKGREGGRAQAILAPHAAWQISGRIAGIAFEAAAGRARGIQQVLILGPIHRRSFTGLYLSESGFFKTPLGNIPVDRGLSEELASRDALFRIDDVPHLMEHSLEVLLPLVKYCFPWARIVPVLMGGPSRPLISALGGALRSVFESRLEHTLIVVSANLGQNRDDQSALNEAETALELLENSDYQGYIRGVTEGGFRACGCALTAGLLESGLLNNRRVRFLSSPLIKILGEMDDLGYLGALAFE
ncbi:MAG: AmmeMemoRadiSam system protein B [Treponema sp.]|jgi:AmmeMemoRadiSam system protein B|nr:AmmeMemoRadiSam system protein B [Treponema sp.]